MAKASQDSVRVSTPSSAIGLADLDGRVYLREVTDVATGKAILQGSPEAPLWRLSTAPGDARIISSFDSVAFLRKCRNGAEAIWDDVATEGSRLQVTVKVEGDGSGLPRLGLEVSSEEAFVLWDVRFPIVGPLRDGILHTSYGYGKAIPLGAGFRYAGGYPGHHCTMQFMAWNPGGCNVYMGAHDPKANAKTMEFLSEEACMACRLPVPGRGRPMKSFSIPYPSLVGTIPGDWYDAAMFYRAWALKQTWSSAGPISTRRISARIRDAVLWLQMAGDPESVVPRALEFKSYFGVPTAMHWYVWHEIPFDDRYPEYLPAKKGFKEAVARLWSAGISVMPYINARLWDPATGSWRHENALQAASKDEKLEKYVEVYPSKVPLSPMCPTTALWQRKIASIASALAREYGVQGLYLDQIGAAAPKLCHDESHGHPAGGGSWWVDGYRELLEQARRTVSVVDPDFFLTTESNAEPWNDLLDGVLMCNSTEGEIVPIYPAIYHDMVPAFGAYIFPSDLEDKWAFRVKVSQMFIWGTQLGWLGPWILEPRFSTSAEYLRELARARLGAPDYLGSGAFLRPPRLEGEVGNVRTSWDLWRRRWELDVPVAQASCWRAPDGSVGLAACNMGDASAELEISVSLDDPGWRELEPAGLSSGGMSRADPRIRTRRLHLSLELDARSAICLSSRAKG